MNRKRLGLGALFAAMLLGNWGIVSAQSEPVRVSQQSSQSVPKPNHGLSMDQVETKFGQPLEKVAAVGEPPITRWRYQNFTVYFEHNKVIHAVSHRS